MKHLKLLSLLIAMLLSMPIITSCSEDEEDGLITNGGNSTCLVSVKYSEGGTATISDTEVMSGWEVTLTAIPEKDYRFVNWTVNGVEVSRENPYTTTITADTEFTANFMNYYTPTGEENGHAYVDLGLSVKWATCNVGATSPEDYGYYFAWGETSLKTTFNWSTYKYYNGAAYSMTKYCTNSRFGTVDNKTTLELSDDAAHVYWGGSWRMPTATELYELIEYCTWTWWTIQNRGKGYKVTSKKNGNSIFLPADISRDNYGYYWSSSLYPENSNNAFSLFFYSRLKYFVGTSRYIKCFVRAVCP